MTYFIMLHLNVFSQSFRIPLGAVGYYVVAKYTPMTPDGECGEPVYVLSERAVESKLNHINIFTLVSSFCDVAYLHEAKVLPLVMWHIL